jgi:hypothetical protein
VTEYQIILLPKQDYWAWVSAAKSYAVRFGANLTSDPDTAGRYMRPQQVVTVAGHAAGYPAHGDILAWFQAHYPNVRIDLVPGTTPAELQAVFDARNAAGARYLPATDFSLRWPTDFSLITQPFGANPEYYRRWNLPGHDGLDIFAHRGAKVYSCADGKVSEVVRYDGNPSTMPYGNTVRLQHRDGYQTVYAHLDSVLASVGDVVEAGQVIGHAGSTGDTAIDHLHLMLQHEGATAAGQTRFPNDIIDPTPHMAWPGTGVQTAPERPVFPWPPGHCLVGVHGRADGQMQAADYTALNLARIEAVKLLTTAQPHNVDELRGHRPNIFILMRLFAHFDGRVVRSDEFATWLGPEILPFYQRGVRYFEIHNEPNLRLEGWTQSWNNGHEFAAWFIDVRNRLRPQFPEALWGYPGLSPGHAIPGIRADALTFLTESDEAVRLSDWIGVHCYWVSESEFLTPAGALGYLEFRRRFPDKLLFITEFSNPADGTDKSIKGQQYVRYYRHLRGTLGVGAAFAFVVSASIGFHSEVWRNEDGSMTPIPALVGARQDVITPAPPPPPGG